MPTKRDKPDAEELSKAERAWLAGDPFRTDNPFPSEEAERAAWEAYRAELLADARAGSRPAAFWRFETDLGRFGPSWEDFPGVESMEEFRKAYPPGWSEEAAYLDAHDLLTDAEREAVESRVAATKGGTR